VATTKIDPDQRKLLARLGRPLMEYSPLPAAHQHHMTTAKNAWIMGGNRSGKSESNIGYDMCAYAMGCHPWRTTPKRAIIWAATINWQMVGKLLWYEKVSRYIHPANITQIVWHNKQEEIPREIRLINGNRIEFKAYEQGREAFQGRAIDAFYGDEQATRDSEAIWQEIQARLIDRNGFSRQSMTPIIHQQWLEDRITNLPATDSIQYADLNDNRRSRGGYCDDAEIDALIAEWPEEIQETRIKGYFAAFAGAVYRSYRSDVHVIEPFRIPNTWDRWRCIDWGFNNPFCCLWLARNPDGQFFVYREYHKARELLRTHAEHIHEVSQGERYRCTWADHDAQDRFEFEDLGIDTIPAMKDVRRGIECVQAHLKVQANRQPKLYIFNTCEQLRREMPAYKWHETKAETSDPKDEPFKVNDHALDALRYGIYGVAGEAYFSAEDLAA